MKVAIPITCFDSSGGIRVLSILANGLAARGDDVTFVVSSGGNRPFFPLDSRVHIQVLKPNFGNFGNVSSLMRKINLAFGIPRGTDAAIANGFMTAFSVRFSEMIGRTRRGIYFVQHYEPMAFGEYGEGLKWMRAIRKKLAERTYHLGLECVTNSQWTARMLREKHGAEATIVPLGVDTLAFHPLESDRSRNETPVVMTIGNPNKIKRFDLFVEVVRHLKTKMEFRAVVATHDRSRLNMDGLEMECVAPKGDVAIARIYNNAAVFVSTSTAEGFGLPLLEAMACGTPVVTTDSGGILDFCRDGENCRIVDSGRSEDLANAIMQICRDKDLRERLIANGLKTAGQWTWNRLPDSFDKVLRRAILAGASPSIRQ